MELDGKNLWPTYDALLAPYAQKNAMSRGRVHAEFVDPDRLSFQRDRDRIIHTTAFRRLRGKMQVVSPSHSDHFRNRLSHTIEVAQFARDLARQLRLNEDLAEAIALAHDLGHPPFGHAGEKALDEKMRAHGHHFEHNEQSLRIVTFYERRYADFPGLNLSREVLEGLQKHDHDLERSDGETVFSPHLEAQLVDIADEITYLAADIEDGLRGHFFRIEELQTVPIAGAALQEVMAQKFPDNIEASKLFRSTFIRRLIRNLLTQLIADTQQNIAENEIQLLSDVQQTRKILVMFSPAFHQEFLELKQFLIQHYYGSEAVMNYTNQGQAKIYQAFDHLLAHPELLPEEFLPEEDVHQRVCDYIAGMTDRFLEEFIESIS